MDVYLWLRRSMSKPQKLSPHFSNANCDAKKKKQMEYDDEELFGVTEQLIEFVKTFSLDTFKNFPLQEEEDANCSLETAATSGNVQKDLSEWQERHATLVLSKVKELSQLRFRLCPGHIKERQFWRIYFTLVKSYVSEYQLRAIQQARLRQMAIENDAVQSNRAYEVEMSERNQATTYSLENGEG